MPKNRPTAAQRARQLQAATGGTYTDVLHSLGTPAEQSSPLRADAWLRSILGHLQDLGWPTSSPEQDADHYRAHCGPVQLDAARDIDDIDAEADDADPDDPRWADAPLYLGVLAPPDATIEDLETGARAGAETPKEIAVRVDGELAQARLRRVQSVEAESTQPCPICGDRYPGHQLLATSSESTPTCAACVWDGDQHFRADLPYLAVQIDQLLYHDLAVPAGWSAVAAVLALTCGANLGRRLEREMEQRGGWPIIMEWWDRPMESWIWLPPHETRHPAFAHLGAGACLAAITEALERHDPTLPKQARQVCRDAEVRWRPTLWPAAIAMAVAFTTQSLERDQHRKPVHVVDSMSDGLSQIRAPFAVSGDALNVECGLQELLEYLLFPLLLGHGLRDEPRDEQRRIYGSAEDDPRPRRSRSDAHISHETDRAAQVAVVLGQIPGVSTGEVIWDGRAETDHGATPLGPTSPVNAEIDKLRQAARIHTAELMYDAGGGIAMIADEAWSRAGWWIPADDAAYAVRQARDFLTGQPYVNVLWAGAVGSLPGPQWRRVQVAEVNAHSTGPQDVPWLRVSDGTSVFGMRLSDIALVRRADPADQLRPTAEPEAAVVVEGDPGPPSADDLSLLIDQYLHLAGHQLGPDWQVVDQSAYNTSQQLLAAMEQAHRGHFLTTFKLSINLFDTWHECPGGKAKKSPAMALSGRPYETKFSFVKHDPECCDAPYACEIANELPALITVLALFGGTVEASPSMPEDKPDDSLRISEIYWEVKDWELEEVCRRLWRAERDAPGGGIVEVDTNPPYLPPWSIAEGWTVPEGTAAMLDAVPSPGWEESHASSPTLRISASK